MPNTPLNPDALASMARIHFESGRTDHRKWEHLYPEIQDTMISEMRTYAEAVLAAAHPVVNSVEELDALPFNTVAMFTMLPLDRPVPFELSSINGTDRYWMQPGDGAGYTNVIMARYLPARVLYRPTEEPTNGR